jgi:hypothetical protein
MARFEIRIASSAMADIQKISRWWVKHRPASPRLFDRELDAILDLLELQPESAGVCNSRRTEKCT